MKENVKQSIMANFFRVLTLNYEILPKRQRSRNDVASVRRLSLLPVYKILYLQKYFFIFVNWNRCLKAQDFVFLRGFFTIIWYRITFGSTLVSHSIFSYPHIKVKVTFVHFFFIIVYSSYQLQFCYL